MLSLAIFSGSRVDGSRLHPGESLFSLCLFGGSQIDLTGAPSEANLTIVAIFGGAKVTVRADEDVELSGFSLFGGRNVEPRLTRRGPRPGGPDDDELPRDIFAYCLFGGLHVARDLG